MSLDGASMTNVLRLGLATGKAPFGDIKIRMRTRELKASGKLGKRPLSVPSSMTATVSAAPDGSMRLSPTKLKAVGVPVKGLLDLLGLDVGDLMKMPPGLGMRAEGDDLLMDTAAMLPPPRAEGRFVAWRYTAMACRSR